MKHKEKRKPNASEKKKRTNIASLFSDEIPPDDSLSRLKDREVSPHNSARLEESENSVASSVQKNIEKSFDASWLLNHNVDLLQHICGVWDSPAPFADIPNITIRTEDKSIVLMIDKNTKYGGSSSLGNHNTHVLWMCSDNHCNALLICDEEFYRIFDQYDTLFSKYIGMCAFLNMSSDKQSEIIAQRNSVQCVPVGKSVERFHSQSELEVKYHLCKHLYSLQQQRVIEDMFSQCSKSSKKEIIKLKYILNIDHTAVNQTSLLYSDIMTTLDRKIYNMKSAKERIVECLIANQHAVNKSMRILLVGGSGVGKTLLAKTVAEISGRPYEIIPLNGISSAIDLKGLDSSYEASDAGKLVKSFASLGTSDALIVLEHIDKMGRSSKDGDPAEALLDTLSDEHLCYDEFLEMSINTSNTLYIATANFTPAIPACLLERFEIITIDDYDIEEKVAILDKFIIPDAQKEFGLISDEICFTTEAIREIVTNYCGDDGLSDAKKNVLTIIRKLFCRWSIENVRGEITVDRHSVIELLEPFVNENDPLIRLARNKERYGKQAIKEIRSITNQLKTPVCEPHIREVHTRRLDYLTAVVSSKEDWPSFDSGRFYEMLNRSHYGMDNIKDRIANEFRSRSITNQSLSGTKILLFGGPGIGKSSICASIAEALEIPIAKISMNGVTDESTIKGHSYSMTAADAGEIVRAMAREKKTRILIQLDEIDKMRNTARNALIDLLDDSAEFTDRFLGVPVDVSDAIFIATANDLSEISPMLMDRFSVIHLEGYTRREKEIIIQDFIIPKIREKYETKGLKFEISPEALMLLLDDYCISGGARDIDRAMKQIVNDKICKASYLKKGIVIQIDAPDVIRSLGEKPLIGNSVVTGRIPGVTHALAVISENCGALVSIGSAVIGNESELEITGLPDDSTIDSVKVARSYIRCHYREILGNKGIHLHFGEGSVVKNGASAGVAILLSLLSAVSNTPLREKCACTGEINLNGDVLAVGGVMAKIQAAERAGCTRVYIPAQNYASLQPSALKHFSIQIVPVTNVSEVIYAVLPDLKHSCSIAR